MISTASIIEMNVDRKIISYLFCKGMATRGRHVSREDVITKKLLRNCR
jgi:hypothetical protein